jgi:hypothetical protein
MAAKKSDSTSALVTVVKALEALDETGRQWVLQSAANRWTLSLQLPSPAGGGNPGGGGGTPNGANAADAQSAIVRKDARSFIRAKKPASDVERVACLGYYLLKTTAQPGFTSKDLAAAHTDSGGSKINMPRALDNATRQSKFLSNRSRSEKQLTTLGEDVAEALPDRDRVNQIMADAKGARKGKRAKAKKTKKG